MTSVTIELEEELTIRQALNVYTQVLSPLAERHAIKLNCQRLLKIDTAGAQLLYLLIHTCNLRNIPIQYDFSHSEIQAYLTNLGITLPAQPQS